MHEHHHAHRVRYRECDRMGIVYHTHYLDYFEAARTEMIRELGVPYLTIEDSGLLIQVVQVNIRFHSPAFYDDELVVTARVSKPPSTRLVVENEVRRKGETKILASGQIDLCFVDAGTKRPVRAPDYFVAAFERVPSV
ncbi:MAG TPA: thioesterase family protein [Rhodothermales bacterium]|nr:thioesterase family protein [Rhodothermales bacterium]